MAWCLQCGSEGRPELAVGVDEDGEPACVFHRVKPNKVESEAPSPLQTTQKEADMGTKSQGVRPQSECKVCGKELATFMMERHMKAKHGGVEAGMQKAAAPIYGGGAIDLAAIKADLQRKLAAIELVEQMAVQPA